MCCDTLGRTRIRFRTGSIETHKEASTHWVKDIGPIVESYIGFVETYVDPYGSRAEWMGNLAVKDTTFKSILTGLASSGFTAIVDKGLSKKYSSLVDDASQLIRELPWGERFEVDEFKKPDFTALEVVTFVSGGQSLRRL